MFLNDSYVKAYINIAKKLITQLSHMKTTLKTLKFEYILKIQYYT